MSGHICPWWGGYFIDNPLRRLLHRPEEILGPYVKPGMTVMDVGCGMGWFSIPMARMVGQQGCVVAVDVQQKMLDVLRKRAEKAGVADRIRLHHCQPSSIGIDDPVDFVLASWSAHEVPDLENFLGEIGACLRPDGRFLVAEPRFHISSKAFRSMVSTARGIGLTVVEEPHVRMSMAVVFAKEITAES